MVVQEMGLPKQVASRLVLKCYVEFYFDCLIVICMYAIYFIQVCGIKLVRCQI